MRRHPDVSAGPSWQRRCGCAVGGWLAGPRSGPKKGLGRFVGCQRTQGGKGFLFDLLLFPI
jgi:hypothetical protein